MLSFGQESTQISEINNRMGEALKNAIFSAIEKEATSLRTLSMEIWNNPELCFKEHHAHKVLTSYLSDRGFEVTEHYKLDTAFKATFSTAGSGQSIHIGVLCEYDALPGIGHACGHNLIAILGVAIGLGIKEAMESGDVKGELTVLGTPAEEGGGGKIDLMDAGAFSQFDIAIMAHPSQFNLPKPVYVAKGGFNVEYEGKASHAASAPWSGVNALDAAVLCYQNVSCMRQHLKPTWRAHGIITNGGEAPNVIPEAASLQYYTRAPSMPELQELEEKMIGCFEGAAKATGCQVKYVRLPKPYHPLNSNPTMASLYQKHGEVVGIEFENDPLLLNKQGGSTDMGNVSRVLPSIHPKYSLKTKAAGHTKEFRDVAGTEASHSITLQHAKALALTAVEVMQSPTLLQTIKDEFNKSMK